MKHEKRLLLKQKRRAERAAKREIRIAKTKQIGLGYMNIIAEFQPNDILKLVDNEAGRHRLEINGHVYSPLVESLRLQQFKRTCICVSCGIEGNMIRLESPYNSTDQPHYNLYHIREDGIAVLMTRDHVRPSSKGGCDSLENSQTMCCLCNGKKGNTETNKVNAV